MPIESLLTQPISCPAKRTEKQPRCVTPSTSSTSLFTSPTNSRIISNPPPTHGKLPVTSKTSSTTAASVGENERAEINNQINNLHQSSKPLTHIPLTDQHINTVTSKTSAQREKTTGKYSFASTVAKSSTQGQNNLINNPANHNHNNTPQPAQGHSLRLTNKVQTAQPPLPVTELLTQNTDMDLFDDGLFLCSTHRLNILRGG